MSTNVGQNNNFLGQINNLQSTNPELEALRQHEEANNPSILKFRYDLSKSESVHVAGDQFVLNTKKEEKQQRLFNKLASLFFSKESEDDDDLVFSKKSEDDDDNYAQMSAYNDLIPMANINKTLKEHALMKKAFAEVSSSL